MSKYLLEAIEEYKEYGSVFEEMHLDAQASINGYTLDSGEFWFTLTRGNECQAYKFAPYALKVRENEIALGCR